MALKMFVLGVFAALATACTTTVDDEAARDEALAECQLIQDAEERLECLDDVARGPDSEDPAEDPAQDPVQ